MNARVCSNIRSSERERKRQAWPTDSRRGSSPTWPSSRRPDRRASARPMVPTCPPWSAGAGDLHRSAVGRSARSGAHRRHQRAEHRRRARRPAEHQDRGDRGSGAAAVARADRAASDRRARSGRLRRGDPGSGICAADEVDVLVTDAGIDADQSTLLADAGVRVVLA